jgi:hypothetical protein
VEKLPDGQTRVLMADSCGEDPSAARGRAFGSNVRITELEPGKAAIFSCCNSEQGFEHDGWQHGVFTKAFLAYCNALVENSDSTLLTMPCKTCRGTAYK